MPSNFDALISKVENYEPLTQEHPKVIAIAKVAVEELRKQTFGHVGECGACAALVRIEAIALGEDQNKS